MPVIYSPKLSEVYRTTFYTIPSSIPGFISSGEVLVADGQGATIWQEITGTTVPIQTVSVANTLSTNQLNTNFISAGSIVLNTATVPETKTNTISTGTFKTQFISTQSLSTNYISSQTINALDFKGSSIQSEQLSTTLLQANLLESGDIYTDSLSSELFYTNQSYISTGNINITTVSSLETSFINNTNTNTSTIIVESTHADLVSTGVLNTQNLSTQSLYVSSINDIKYPLDLSISTDPQFSTILLQNTLNTASTLTTTISANTIIANATTISSISVETVTAPQIKANLTNFNAISTNTIQSQSTLALILSGTQVNANLVSSSVIEAAVGTLQTITAESGITQELRANYTKNDVLHTNLISSGLAVYSTLQTQVISTSFLSSGTANIPQVLFSSIQANNISLDSVNTTQNFITILSATDSISTFAATADSISAATVFAPKASNVEVFTSTINGSPFPVVFSVNPDLILSTISVQDTITVQSTLATTLSTGILTAPILTSSIATNSISTGIINASSAEFSSGLFAVMNTNTIIGLESQFNSTFLNTSIQFSTLNAQNITLTSLSTASVSTSQLIVTTNAQISQLNGDSLSTGTLIATYVDTPLVVVTSSINSQITNLSTLSGQNLITNTISSGLVNINSFSISTLNTNYLETDRVFINNTLGMSSLNTNTISTATLLANTLNVNTLATSTISTSLATVSTFTTGATTIEYLSSPNAIYTPIMNITNLNTSTISSGIGYINYGTTSFLTASSFTFNTAIVNYGLIDNLSAITINTSNLFMTNDICQLNANSMSVSTINTFEFSPFVGTISSIQTTEVITENGQHEVAIANQFRVDNLTTDSIAINSVLANITSTNLISTITAEGGNAQFTTLETNKVQVPSTFVSFISSGHVNADIISTHTITIWGPNTLLVQGTSILDGAINQTGELFIESLQTSSMTLLNINNISSIQIQSADVSTLTSEKIIASTLTVSTIDIDISQSQTAFIKQSDASSINTYYVSTGIINIQAVFGSTLTLNSFTTISTITQIDTLTVETLVADYLGVLNTLSTTSMEISTLTTTQSITSSMSVGIVSTAALEFGTLSIQGLQTNNFSTANLSTASATFQTIGSDTLEVTDLTSRIVRGTYLSTGSLVTTTNRISSLITDILSTTVLSTGILESGTGYFENLSTNRLTISGIYSQNARISSIDTNFISAGTIVVFGGFSTLQLTVGSYSTGATVLAGDGVIAANTVSTNLFSTAQVLSGNDSIFIANTISTNLLSTLEITADFAISSTIITSLLSAGNIYLSSYSVSSLSTNIVDTNIFNTNFIIRPMMLNVNTISTASFLLNQVLLTNLSTNSVSTTRSEFISASIQSISTTNLVVTQNFMANQAIFASIITDSISVGNVFTTTRITISSFSTNFISTGSISSAVANLDIVSTNGISTTLQTIANGLFVDTVSTGFLRSGIINASSPTYGELRVSSINGQLNGVSITGAANVVNMTVKNTTQCLAHSTILISTQYTSVRGETNINTFSIFDGWLLGLSSSGTGSVQRIRYNRNPLTTNWSNASMTNVGADNFTFGFAFNGEYILALRSNTGNNPKTTILLSYDAINWQTINSGGFQGYAYAAKWNGRMWVAVGHSNTTANVDNPVENIQYSYDGLNWSNSLTVPAKLMNMRGLDWNGSLWVAGGGVFDNTTLSTSMAYSSDGSNWSRVLGLNNTSGRFGGGSNGVFSVCWANNIWVAVGNGSGGLGSAQIQFSENGSNWFQNNNSNTLNLNQSGTQTSMFDVKWGSNKFIAVGQFSSFVESSDGKNWTLGTNISARIASPLTSIDYDIRFDRWVATRVNTTSNQRVITSTDGGTTWSAIGSSDQAATPTGIFITNPINPSRPDLQIGNIEFYTNSISAYFSRAHQIFVSTSYLQFDNFATILRNTNQFLINAPILPQSTASLIVNGQIGCSGNAFKPTSGTWTTPSDRRIKQNIQLANYEQCYNTMKNIPLYRYSFIDAYKETVTLRDQSVLGFIAQDVSNYFPKAVQVTSNLGFSDLLLLDSYQVEVLHYGATRHLISINEQQKVYISSFYTSTLANASKYISSVSETFVTLEQQYSQLSTLMAKEANQRYESYESTITSHFITISTLTANYESLSTLIGERVPLQPPQEEV